MGGQDFDVKLGGDAKQLEDEYRKIISAQDQLIKKLRQTKTEASESGMNISGTLSKIKTHALGIMGALGIGGGIYAGISAIVNLVEKWRAAQKDISDNMAKQGRGMIPFSLMQPGAVREKRLQQVARLGQQYMVPMEEAYSTVQALQAKAGDYEKGLAAAIESWKLRRTQVPGEAARAGVALGMEFGYGPAETARMIYKGGERSALSQAEIAQASTAAARFSGVKGGFPLSIATATQLSGIFTDPGRLRTFTEKIGMVLTDPKLWRELGYGVSEDERQARVKTLEGTLKSQEAEQKEIEKQKYTLEEKGRKRERAFDLELEAKREELYQSKQTQPQLKERHKAIQDEIHNLENQKRQWEREQADRLQANEERKRAKSEEIEATKEMIGTIKKNIKEKLAPLTITPGSKPFEQLEFLRKRGITPSELQVMGITESREQLAMSRLLAPGGIESLREHFKSISAAAGEEGMLEKGWESILKIPAIQRYVRKEKGKISMEYSDVFGPQAEGAAKRADLADLYAVYHELIGKKDVAKEIRERGYKPWYRGQYGRLPTEKIPLGYQHTQRALEEYYQMPLGGNWTPEKERAWQQAHERTGIPMQGPMLFGINVWKELDEDIKDLTRVIKENSKATKDNTEQTGGPLASDPNTGIE